MSLSYAILGTGALGGYYGGQLARAGRRVHFLLHSDYVHVQQHGLRVDTPSDSYTILPGGHDVTFHGDADDMPAADVVLICLKTTQNHLLPDLLPKPGSARWTPGTLVITLQNGLHPERDAAAVVGDEHVAGGLCFLCSNKVGPGHLSYLDYGFIKLGSHVPGRHRDRLDAIASDFRGAGVDCDVVDDLVLARWQKLVWNVPYNGLSVVLNMTTDQMMADPDVRQRVEALMHEVAAAAKAVDGKTIDPAFIQNMLDYTAKMAPYKTSMMLDYEAGKPMEIEAILGDALRAVRKSDLHSKALPQAHYELARLYGELNTVKHGIVGDRVTAKTFKSFTDHCGVSVLHVDAIWDQSGWPKMVQLLRKTQSRLTDKVVFGFLECDQEGDLCRVLGVTAIPMAILFRDGVPVDRQVGSDGDLYGRIQALLGD